MDNPDFSFSVDILNWSKRRRVILQLLDHPRFEWQVERIDSPIPKIIILANLLANKCDENGHPRCAEAIRLRLQGFRVLFFEE
jgi:hypothetical protein